MRPFIYFKTKVLALVLTIAALAAGHGSAWAASTFRRTRIFPWQPTQPRMTA